MEDEYKKGFYDGQAHLIWQLINGGYVKIGTECYMAVKPMIKTIHKDGEVVISGFRKVETDDN